MAPTQSHPALNIKIAHDLNAKPLTPSDQAQGHVLADHAPKAGGDAMADDADVIVVGGGLAGLVAATEIADAGKRVIVVDQEGEQSLGGQAFWSFGGLFLVDSPEQRRLGIKDSYDLALQDWMGSAGFDRDEDLWPKRWAEAYVAFAAGEKRGCSAPWATVSFRWSAGPSAAATTR